MKKFLNWLKGPKSDFALFIVLIILVNLVAHNAFVRFDLTAPKSYTLSKASKTIVKNLEEPLSIRVFFDDTLPAPYNSIAQYIKDILFEYKNAGNKQFSVAYMDMSKQENRELAGSLGLREMQIQEIKNNEVGFKSGFMGMILTYGDNIEIMDRITSTEGLEYNITSKITKMINTAVSLESLKNGKKMTATLYVSDSLKRLHINGADQVEKIVRDSVAEVNKKNQDCLDFNVVSPASGDVDALAQQYGIQKIGFQNSNKQEENAGLGLVVQYEENFKLIPITVQRGFFGYGIDGLEGLSEAIAENMHALITKVSSIGYITGHNELDHMDDTYCGFLDRALASMYKIEDIDLNTADIPATIGTIMINGPQYDYTEEELYKIDQFIMRGGNVLFFVDGMNQDGTAQYTGGQSFVPNEINIDRLLMAYGIDRKHNMVFDKQCFINNQTQYGKLNYYWAPELQKGQLAKKNPITKNLGYVYMFQNGELDLSAARENKDVKVTVLAKSSDEAWTMDNNIMLNPMALNPPAELKSYDLVALVEGKFKSAFESAPVAEDENHDDSITSSTHLSSSVRPGKIFVSNSSYITTRNVINETANTPAAMFVLNSVDYMNGNVDLCTMRSKSISANTLTIKSNGAAIFWKYFNEVGLAALVALAGLLVWRLRTKRRKAINAKYNPNDTRIIVKEKKNVKGE